MTAPITVYSLSFLLLLSLTAGAQQTRPHPAQQAIPHPAQQTVTHVAQQVLTGKIKRRSTSEVLPSVSVINRSQKRTNISDQGGNYRIPARPGDTIVFTSAGYQPDTAFVSAWMFQEKDGYLVAMTPNLVELPAVQVDDADNYRKDSTKRKEEYAWVYPTHRRRLIGSETPEHGFGIIVSPVDYFSARETQRRRLRRRLRQEEIDYYIDFRYPRAYVARITGLTGDSLQTFMSRYRPTYKFCRNASNEDILLYINEKVKDFRHGS